MAKQAERPAEWATVGALAGGVIGLVLAQDLNRSAGQYGMALQPAGYVKSAINWALVGGAAAFALGYIA